MKTKLLTLATLAFIGLSTANAQVGIGTTTPDASAGLDVNFNDKGFLPPRLTTAQRDENILNPAEGLTIYNTDQKCSNVYVGLGWRNLCAVVGANDVINPQTGKIWMDRNLGASRVAINSTDANSYGDYYQWGRGTDGHQISNSGVINVQSSLTSPGDTFISVSLNWYNGSDPDDLWQGVNGTNNPCPSGYRLPTETELNAERASWGGSNNSAGAFASPLKLPMAGYRDGSSGSLSFVGTAGLYWSSTVSSANSRYLDFFSSNANMFAFNRAYGVSVRCLKD